MPSHLRRSIVRARAGILPVLLAFAGLVPAPAAMATDAAIRAAAEAFQKRDAPRLARQIEPSRGHPLVQYVDYWVLRVALDEQPADAVRGFLEAYPGTYLAERLRGEWVKSLAKRGDWTEVPSAIAGVLNDDNDLACIRMNVRMRAGGEPDPERWRPIWMQPRELSEPCLAVAEALVQSGRIGRDAVWERARALGEMNQTGAMRRTLAWLPAGDLADPRTIDQIVAQPQKLLDAGAFDLGRRAGREFYAFAVSRMARKDAASVAPYLSAAVQKRFPEAERGNLLAQAALPAARSHGADAVAWYAQAGVTPLSDEQVAWRMRAALREGRWADVKRATDAMTPAQRADPAWTYWRARALQTLREPDEATTLYRTIAGQHHFYGNLAAEELGESFSVPPKGHAPTDEEVAAVAKDAGLNRALALLRLGMRPDAIREWVFATRGWTDQSLLAAAEFARRQEVWDRAINTAERTSALHDFGLRFLAPYRELFAANAAERGLDEHWVLGLVRQESRFMVDVKSSAGAAGLMQLMPGTARYVARKIGDKDFAWSRVFEPEVNIRLGTSYMRQVLDDLEGHPLLASAAYNAGPGRAQRWRAGVPLEGAVYAESIPFNETRDYVKRVFSNTMYYAALAGAEMRSLKARLGVVPARRGSTPPDSARPSLSD